MTPKKLANEKRAIRGASARDHDLNEAYRFLIPDPVIGKKGLLTRQEEERGRAALARLLRDDTFATGPELRELRYILAAVFDPEPQSSVNTDDMAEAYTWLAGERIAKLSFRDNKRRKPPLRDTWIGVIIADVLRREPSKSIEKAIFEVSAWIEDLEDKEPGKAYETTKNAWAEFRRFLRSRAAWEKPPG